MKKLILFLVCFVMVGCQASSQVESTHVDESQWEGHYVCKTVHLLIEKEDDYDGLVFTIEHDGESFKDYAYFLDDQHLEAISDLTEDGYTFEFSLQKNKVIVKESGGIGDLGISLSGEYVKE